MRVEVSVEGQAKLMMARYYQANLGRFMAVDPGEDSELESPQSWNKNSYVRNNPLAYLDSTGEAITYASADQKTTLDQQRAQSPSLNTALSAFVGKDAPNLTMQYGDAGKDPNGKDDADGDTKARISPGYDASKVQSEADLTDENLSSDTTTFVGATIIIDNSVKGTSKESDTTLHEIGHANDARTNTVQYLRDSNKTDKEKGKTPHKKRPEEQRANAFKDKVKNEIKVNKKNP